MKNSARHKVIIVGVDYLSFKLYKLLKSGTKFTVINFIDDNPWSHKTLLEGITLRYSSELIGLSENNNVKAILCVEEQVLEKIRAELLKSNNKVTPNVMLIPRDILEKVQTLEEFIERTIFSE